MSEETNESPDKTSLANQKWIIPPDGRCDVYSNLYHLHWTLTDVRIRFASIFPDQELAPVGAVARVQEMAAVTMSWAQAKALRDSLAEAVKRYEDKNGEIKPPQLP